jgi:predicted outer membrane repeat protein
LVAAAIRHRSRLQFEPLEDRRLLAIVVDTLLDENDGVAVGGISLRDAITAAPAGETIEFAPALTDAGPATIMLTRGELLISNNLTINGPGASLLTIDASGNDPSPNVNNGNGSRVFHITDAADTLKEITIRNLTLTGGDASGAGGGILSRENLTLVGCVVTGNATFTNAQLGGGGIYSASYSAIDNSLTLIDCTITNNSAIRDDGGGIRSRYGSLTMERCLVKGNTASTYGGGLSGADGGVEIQIRSTTFEGNTATRFSGGGIFTYDAVLTLVDSTVSGNTAGWGAGVYLRASSTGTVERSAIINNVARVDGGGISLNESQLTLTGSTLSGNSAAGYGGGAAIPNGMLVMRHCTVTGNRANTDNLGGQLGGGVILGTTTTLTLDHTIVAGNFRNTSTRDDVVGDVAARFSLIGDGTDAAIINNGGNLVGDAGAPIDPRLGPLAPNGGPTLTHALLPDSPAIGAGDPAAMAGGGTVPTFDQRGASWPRIAGGQIDIGAFEQQPISLTGDYNSNGIVDAADYVLWRKTLGSSSDLRADGNASGVVDQADYDVWRANFGATSPSVGNSATATVPAVTEVLPQLAQSSPEPGTTAWRGRARRPTATTLQVADRENALLAWLDSRQRSPSYLNCNDVDLTSDHNAISTARSTDIDAALESFVSLEF